MLYKSGMEKQEQQFKKDWKLSAVFVVTGLFIGALLTVQFQSSIPSSTFLSDELRAQKDLIDGYVDDQGLLKSKIIGLRTEISEAQERAEASIQSANLETLKALKEEIGLTSLRGPGVEIVIDDGIFVNRDNPDTVSQSLVHASDLRDIVNILRTARVQAISINGQRVIATTSISSVGNTILVNNFHLLPPFTVSALGDPEVVMQRLNDPTALPDLAKRTKDLNIQFMAQSKEGILIPEYSGNLSSQYISEVDVTNQ
ncbi:MAG TPA: DUF881 domain-containing protein [Candidatus Gracilibacteria bacterium]|nr:DUF881 domain-containing protein [Candidatus Gracilibacteria bacterium]